MILEIDTASERPIYQQIVDEITIGIYKNELSPGESLPSSRKLAEAVGVNFMTVNKAYGILKDKGLVVADRARGTRVSENPVTKAPDKKALKVLLVEEILSGTTPEELLERIDTFLKEDFE